MQFFQNTKIDFVGKRKMGFMISAIIILLGLVSWGTQGLKRNIDFTGGLSLELDLTPITADGVTLESQYLRDVLAADGIVDLEIQDATNNGKSYFIIKAKTAEGIGDKIVKSIKTAFPENCGDTMIRLQEEVGPRIGKELGKKAIWAILYSLLGIIIYIAWRFQFTFGIAACIALAHDVLITLGIFSLLGKEISLPVVAALLTIVGYSLNDTIVVFDRIREDLKVYRKESYESIINHSINETLSRTIITSVTTFVVVACLYIFGGSVIHDFAFALLIGVVVGTYSSIFVASPILVEYFNKKQRQMALGKK